MKNEIMDEVWRAKDSIALKHNYDVKALSDYLRKKDNASSRKVVDLHAIRQAASGKSVHEEDT